MYEKIKFFLPLLTVWAMGLQGCQTTTGAVITKAEHRIREANKVDAPKHAPGDYAVAVDKLAQAQKLYAEGDLQAGLKAQSALEYAEKAYKVSSLAWNLERTQKTLETTRVEAKTQITGLEKEIEAADAERKRLLIEGNNLTAEGERLRSVIAEQNRSIVEMEGVNKSYSNEVNSLQDQIQKLGTARDQLTGERKQLAADLEARTRELGIIAARGDSLALELQKVVGERTRLETELAKKDKSLAEVQSAAASLRDDINAKNDQIIGIQKQVHKLRLDQLSADSALTDARTTTAILQRKIASTESDLANLRTAAETLRVSRQAADSEVQRLTAENAEKLTALNQKLQQIDAQKTRYEGDLTAANEALAQKTDTLKKAEQENRDLMSDLGQLQTEQVRLKEDAGRIVLTFVDKILFLSGSVDIESKGRDSLKSVARVLKKYPNRMVQIAGHTDTVPISTPRFPSNWQLSAARATEVLRVILTAEPELNPARFIASGFGEYQNVATNQTPDGRTENRRVEIVILRGTFELGKGDGSNLSR